jgi:hypothetical protein
VRAGTAPNTVKLRGVDSIAHRVSLYFLGLTDGLTLQAARRSVARIDCVYKFQLAMATKKYDNIWIS